MRRDEPELFHKAADLEKLLNERRAILGKDPVWLTRFNKPLEEAIPFPIHVWISARGRAEGCDSGHCWT